MENNQLQPKENIQVASIDGNVTTHNPAIYKMAPEGKKLLTEEQSAKLTRNFDDLQCEIRPDGIIYIPAALIRMRFIEVLGPSGFSIILLRDLQEPFGQNGVKRYYDGGLYIDGYFSARSMGEGIYNKDDPNTSQASALESAKTDCFVRCAKDMGVGLQVFDPSYIRYWQKKYAVKVWVVEEKNGQKKKTVKWRRCDVDPFYNETDAPATSPTVPVPEKPWLNHGPDYDTVLKQLLECKVTLEGLKDKWRISSKTWESLVEVLTKEWAKYVSEKKDMTQLPALYNQDINWIKKHDFVLEVFTKRKQELNKKQPA